MVMVLEVEMMLVLVVVVCLNDSVVGRCGQW